MMVEVVSCSLGVSANYALQFTKYYAIMLTVEPLLYPSLL